MKKLIIGNWKMNPTTSKHAQQLFNSLKKAGLKSCRNVEVVICPPFVYLNRLELKDLKFKIGAQNCFWEKAGAFTGEISPAMLKDCGVKYVILGHSERREIFGETEKMIAEKTKAVLRQGLIPVVCVGETKEQQQKGEVFEVLEKEIQESLGRLSRGQVSNVVIAYEPIWAIGTGRSCSLESAGRAILLLRKVISQLFEHKIKRNVRILYGGSVNCRNACEYLREPWIDGLLVGGASLNPGEFTSITKSANMTSK